MDSTELQTYELQLEQVQTALTADPENEELRTLEGELHNLISMTRELLEQQEAEAAAAASGAAGGGGGGGGARGAKGKGRQADQQDEEAQVEAGPSKAYAGPAQSAPARQYAAGEEVMAKYASDGRWYPARVISVGGSVHNRVYSIVFKGYNTTELLSASDIKPSKNASSNHYQAMYSTPAAPSSSYGLSSADGSAPTQPDGSLKTRALDPNADKERKKRRVEKSKERHATKAAEQQTKQQAWQKFAKKKSSAISGVGGKSMFRTPDDPLAKVGVVGAGRGMTQTAGRSKHVYEPN